MSLAHEENNDKNLAIWKSIYSTYEKGTLMPGTQYPNLRLVDFIRRWKNSPNWPTDRRPRVLEFGFGSIANMRMMALEGCDVHGLEVSEDAVDVANEAIKFYGFEEHLSAAYFESVPLSVEDGYYDAIIGLQCVYNNLDQEFFADECARMLTPGGIIFFSFFTTHHGYMKHIDGEPGGVVSFTDNHPNPRLPGLEVFLYKNSQQLEDIYGRSFDLNIDGYETDLLEVHQSWHYLRGQKKNRPDNAEMQSVGSTPTELVPLVYIQSTDTESQFTQTNILALENLSTEPDGTTSTILQEYPNVEIVRFLASWKRRQDSDYFRPTVGQEVSISKVENLAALEVNCLGPSHIIAMDRFNYLPTGVCLNTNMRDKIIAVTGEADLKHLPTLEIWHDNKLPFQTGQFDVAFSLASNLIANQKEFVEEVSRTVAEDGEIFMAYISPQAGVFSSADHLSGNYYQLTEDFDDLNCTGLKLFAATDENLASLWEKYFDVTINHFEYGGLPHFQSFQVISGKRSSQNV